MSKRVTVNMYDFDTGIEEVRTSWEDGSNIIVRSNTRKEKTKIQVLDCTNGNNELICKKFKLNTQEAINAYKFIVEYSTKFDESNK